MKVLYSFWGNGSPFRSGYRNQKNFLFGLSLSVMLANEYYDPVLYTGLREWKVIKEAKLPWHRVHIVNFDQYDIPKGLWNFSKFVALDREDPPFVHIDNDFFLFDKLPEFDEMMFQEKENVNERGDVIYKNCIDFLEDQQKYQLPRIWNGEENYAYSCGVIGSKNEEFVNEWMEETLSWVLSDSFNKLVENELHKDQYYIPPIPEQFLASCLDRSYGNISEFLLDEYEDEYTDWPKNGSYVHLISVMKRRKESETYIQKKLHERYQVIFNRIDQITQ